jgi:hypothetical protein
MEAAYGRTRDVLIPVLIDATTIPFGYEDIQAANLITWQPGRRTLEFDDLLRAIETVASRSIHTTNTTTPSRDRAETAPLH